MSRPLVGYGNGCTLHGALAAALAIDGVIPLVHSTPGCALRGAFATRQSAGWSGAPLHLPPIASTNLAEKHIVFGGASRLREQIKNALAVLPHGLLVVITGCPTEMIGDDAPAMVKEVSSQGEAILEVSAAGFLGSAHRGYERLLDVLVARAGAFALPGGEATPGLINIFGIAPRYDETWVSDLDEISRLLAGVGLTANPIFGPSGGLSSLSALPHAAATLVLSPWGLAPAQTLQARFKTPVVVANGLPVGLDAVADLLQRLADTTGLIDQETIGRFLRAERRYEDFALDETLDALSRLGRRRAAIVAGSLLAGPLASFLISTVGWEVKTVVLTDEPPAPAATLLPSAVGRIIASADGDVAAAAIRASGADFLLAGARHGALAAELGTPFLPIADLGGRAALSGGFLGTRGSARLLAAIAATLPAARCESDGRGF